MTTRSLRGNEAQGATFVELFFDLVFVFAVTQVTKELAHHLNAGGVLEALVVFWLIWWAWTQYTWSLNEADTEHRSVRLVTLAATAIAFVMAMTVAGVTEDTGWLFPLSYLVLRVMGIGLQWRLAAGDQQWTGAIKRWTAFSAIALLAVAVAIFLPGEQRFWALGVAALLDVGAALQAASAGEWRLFSGHFSERHGLFVIIALGESLIAAGVGASEQELTGEVLAVVLSAVVAACALWWTYFGWVKDALEHRLDAQSAQAMGRFARDVYSFAHFPVIAGVIGLAVAIEESVLHPGDPLPWAGALALVIGLILFLGGTGAALGRAGFGLPIPRIATIVVLAVATPLFAAIPAWSTFAIAATVIAGLALTERPTIARVT